MRRKSSFLDVAYDGRLALRALEAGHRKDRAEYARSPSALASSTGLRRWDGRVPHEAHRAAGRPRRGGSVRSVHRPRGRLRQAVEALASAGEVTTEPIGVASPHPASFSHLIKGSHDLPGGAVGPFPSSWRLVYPALRMGGSSVSRSPFVRLAPRPGSTGALGAEPRDPRRPRRHPATFRSAGDRLRSRPAVGRDEGRDGGSVRRLDAGAVRLWKYR